MCYKTGFFNISPSVACSPPSLLRLLKDFSRTMRKNETFEVPKLVRCMLLLRCNIITLPVCCEYLYCQKLCWLVQSSQSLPLLETSYSCVESSTENIITAPRKTTASVLRLTWFVRGEREGVWVKEEGIRIYNCAPFPKRDLGCEKETNAVFLR